MFFACSRHNLQYLFYASLLPRPFQIIRSSKCRMSLSNHLDTTRKIWTSLANQSMFFSFNFIWLIWNVVLFGLYIYVWEITLCSSSWSVIINHHQSSSIVTVIITCHQGSLYIISHHQSSLSSIIKHHHASSSINHESWVHFTIESMNNQHYHDFIAAIHLKKLEMWTFQ